MFPICLSDQENIHVASEETGIIAGWGGRQKSDHEMAARQTQIDIISRAECLENNCELAKTSSNKTFCGLAANKTAFGPCSGDSGSPLAVKIGSKWFQRGIVSHAMIKDECVVRLYVLYTDVLKYIGWIHDIAIRKINKSIKFEKLPTTSYVDKDLVKFEYAVEEEEEKSKQDTPLLSENANEKARCLIIYAPIIVVACLIYPLLILAMLLLRN